MTAGVAENSELREPDKQARNDSGIFSGFVRNISFAYSLSKSLLLRDSTNKPLLGQVALCCFFFPLPGRIMNIESSAKSI